MTIRYYGFTSLVGEGVGALDKYPEVGSPALGNEDIAIGVYNGKSYTYLFDAASIEPENVPWFISPRVGAGMWKLIPEVNVITTSDVNFPFYKSDGNLDNIALTTEAKLPFTDSSGVVKDIALTA